MHRLDFPLKLCQIKFIVTVGIQDLKNDTETRVLLPDVVFKLLLAALELILVNIERDRLIYPE